MNTIEMNIQAVQMLEKWDPLGYGPEAYDTETADVVSALHRATDVEQLAQKIQAIYEFSFEQWITLENCQQMAQQLMTLKHMYECS